MTAYCTVAQVEDHLLNIAFSETSVPTSAQVTGYLTTIGSEIDGALASRGYALPVSDLVALADLKTTAIYGVCGLVLRAKFMDSEGPGGEGGSAKDWERAFRGKLRDILDGRSVITQPKAAGSIGEGFTRTSAGDPYVPRITRETEW